ncbi:MAG: acyltransferase family protein, partial [Mycetocola sp.]
AVYLMLSALVPLAARWHSTAPGTTLAALTITAVAIDTARALTGIEAIGIPNLLVVWTLVQQLGFWLADGHINRVPRALALTAGTAALGVMVLLTTVGYSADMFVNLNPPTVMIVLLALVQLCAIRLGRTALTRLAARPAVASAVAVLNRDGMTVYLWHMPIMIGLTGLLVLTPLPVPELHSPLWWATRPLWLALICAALGAVVPRITVLTARLGAHLHPHPALGARRVAVASVASVAAVVVILVFSFSVISGLVAVAVGATTATLLTVPPRGQLSEER